MKCWRSLRLPLLGQMALRLPGATTSKSVFKKEYMYRLSCNPDQILYVAENKTLPGKEDRTYEGEAMGRKLAVVCFEDMDRGLVRRVHRDTTGMHQILLSIAEILLAVGIALPIDPERSDAESECLLEAMYENLEILRFEFSIEPAAPEFHVYAIEDGVNAEAALWFETAAAKRTKMMVARRMQRNGDLVDVDTLEKCWKKHSG